MSNYLFSSAATLLVVLVMFFASVMVGRARSQYGVKAPATTGHESFERAFRAQMNTLEWAAMFLPAMWVMATSVGDKAAAVVALIGCIGRVWYILAYIGDPRKREGGFVVGALSLAVACLWSTWALLQIALHS